MTSGCHIEEFSFRIYFVMKQEWKKKKYAVFFCIIPNTVRNQEILYLSKNSMRKHFLQDVSIQSTSEYSHMTLHYQYYQSKHFYSYPSL